MKLVFDITKIPRTTSREAWLKMDRWRRLCEKELSKHEAEMVQALSDVMIYGQARIDIIDHLINPPILLGPHQ